MRAIVAFADFSGWTFGCEMVAHFSSECGIETYRLRCDKKAVSSFFSPVVSSVEQAGKVDFLLISVLTPLSKWSLYHHRKKLLYAKKLGAKIIVGGQAAWQLSDSAFEYVDVIVTGPVFCKDDMQKCIDAPPRTRVALDWARKPPAIVLRPYGWPEIYASVACPNNCFYCASIHGDWSLTTAEMEAALKGTPRGRAIKIYRPDGRFPGDFWGMMRRNGWSLKNQNFYPTTLYEAITEHGAKISHAIVGVEGASRRLRDSLNRAIPENVWQWLLSSPVSNIGFNFICGLPTETEADWLELLDDCNGITQYYICTVTPLENLPGWRYGDISADPACFEYMPRIKKLSMERAPNLILQFLRKYRTHTFREYRNHTCPFAVGGSGPVVGAKRNGWDNFRWDRDVGLR